MNPKPGFLWVVFKWIVIEVIAMLILIGLARLTCNAQNIRGNTVQALDSLYLDGVWYTTLTPGGNAADTILFNVGGLGDSINVKYANGSLIPQRINLQGLLATIGNQIEPTDNLLFALGKLQGQINDIQFNYIANQDAMAQLLTNYWIDGIGKAHSFTATGDTDLGGVNGPVVVNMPNLYGGEFVENPVSFATGIPTGNSVDLFGYENNYESTTATNQCSFGFQNLYRNTTGTEDFAYGEDNFDFGVVTNSIGIGQLNNTNFANASNEILIGSSNIAVGNNDITIGNGITATAANQITIGTSTYSATIAGIKLFPPSEVDLLAQTTATNVVSIIPSALGTYKIVPYVNIISVSTDVLRVVVNYTDETNTLREIAFSPMGQLSASMSTTGIFAFPPIYLRCNPAIIAINSQIVTGGGTINYNISGIITQVQ